jgi:hypothetical protein
MKKLVLVLGLIVVSSACSKDENPANLILGKWELVALGHDEDNIKPIDQAFIVAGAPTMEFLSDGGILRVYYFYAPENPEENSCRIDSEFLYINYEEDYQHGRFDYKYSFYENKLKLVLVHGIITDIFGYPIIYIYQRKK